MGDETTVELTDGQWDALERMKPTMFTDEREVWEKLMALRPVSVRPWQPGDWMDNHAMVVLINDGIEDCLLGVGWSADHGWADEHTGVGWFHPDSMEHIDPPESWVAAGRPGAVNTWAHGGDETTVELTDEVWDKVTEVRDGSDLNQGQIDALDAVLAQRPVLAWLAAETKKATGR